MLHNRLCKYLITEHLGICNWIKGQPMHMIFPISAKEKLITLELVHYLCSTYHGPKVKIFSLKLTEKLLFRSFLVEEHVDDVIFAVIHSP